jgi:N-acyl-D-amino-acid deacylase
MQADLVLRGGRVIDGTGRGAQRADIAIAGGRIVAVGEVEGVEARTVLDVGGLTVCPGFIDMHSHSDYSLISAPEAESRIGQGITTEVMGNCGYSPAPVDPARREATMEWSGSLGQGLEYTWTRLGEFLDRLEDLQVATNVLALVGHGAVRVAAMGFERRAPSATELERMRVLVAEAMADGAYGLSTGLIYPPATYSETDEIVAVARVAARHGGLYFTHMRNEANGLFDAVREALTIGREAGIGVQVSHLKAAGARQWGRMGEVVSLIEEARRRGENVAADFYPYEAGGTFLYGILPPDLMEGGIEGLLARLPQPDTRRRVADAISNGLDGWWNPVGAIGGWDEVTVVELGSKRRDLLGRSVTEIGRMLDKDPLEAALDLLYEERGSVQIVIRMMRDGDIETVARTPWAMMGTDGSAESPRAAEEHLTHPRSYGTTARFLGDYVRRRETSTLEAAIHRMTGMPAARMGLRERGRIAPGLAADLVVFDPVAVADVATYAAPHRPPAGFQHVFVNGVAALKDGSFTYARAGRVLRRR